MFSETQEYDVTMRASGHLEVRRTDVVLRNEEEIARNYHRHIVTPGDDVADEVEIVKHMASLWTEEQIEQARITNES